MAKRWKGLALTFGWLAASTWAGAQTPMPPTAAGAMPGAPVMMTPYGALPAQSAPAMPYGTQLTPGHGEMPPLPAPGLPSGPPPGMDSAADGGNCFSPGGDSCEPHCNPYKTHCWAEFEWILWWMKERQYPPLVTTGDISDLRPGALGSPQTKVVFGNSGSDNTNPFTGGRLWLGWWFTDDHTCAIEANGFYLEHRVGRQTFGSNGDQFFARPIFNVNLGVEDADPISVPGVMGGHIIIEQPRRFFGGETNVRISQAESVFGRSRLSLLLGARYLSLDEKLDINEALFDLPGIGVPGNTFSLDEHFTTYNRFYGGQIGAGWDFHLGDVFLSVDGRVAFGRNHETEKVSGGSAITEPGGNVIVGVNRALLVMPSNVGTSTRNEFSIVHETTVHLGYAFNQNVSVAIGYNFLYWHRVARPSDQIDRAVNIQALQPFDEVGPARPMPKFEQSNFWAQGLSLSLGLSF